MSELISRDRILRILIGKKNRKIDDSLLEEIMSIPTQNPERSKWIKRDDYLFGAYTCSNCGTTFQKPTNFCPECGQKMKPPD